MARRRKIIFSVLVLATVVSSVVISATNREPSYNGKKLSEWLHEISLYNPENSVWDGVPENEKVNEAVLAIGADGFPQMMRWFQTKDSKLEKAIMDFLDTFELSDKPLKREDYYWDLAQIQLKILETNAVPKIKELHQLYIDPETNYRLIGGFGYLGSEAVPYLLTASQSADQTVRRNAVMEFWNMGSDAKAAIPELLRFAQYDSDVSIRSTAIYSITGIAEEPEIVLPILVELASDPEIRIRQYAVWAFGTYQDKAKDHIPFVSSFLTDTNFSQRAAFSLSQIGQDSIPVLTQASTNSNPTVQLYAKSALDMISNPTTPPQYEPRQNNYWVLFLEFNRRSDERARNEE